MTELILSKHFEHISFVWTIYYALILNLFRFRILLDVFFIILVQFHEENQPSAENISATLKINIALESLIISSR